MSSTGMEPDNILGLIVGVVGLIAAVPSLAIFIRWLKSRRSRIQTSDPGLENDSRTSVTSDDTGISMDTLLPGENSDSNANTGSITNTNGNASPSSNINNIARRSTLEDRMALLEHGFNHIRIQPPPVPYVHYLNYAPPVFNFHQNTFMGTNTMANFGHSTAGENRPAPSHAEWLRRPFPHMELTESAAPDACLNPTNIKFPVAPPESLDHAV